MFCNSGRLPIQQWSHCTLQSPTQTTVHLQCRLLLICNLTCMCDQVHYGGNVEQLSCGKIQHGHLGCSNCTARFSWQSLLTFGWFILASCSFPLHVPNSSIAQFADCHLLLMSSKTSSKKRAFSDINLHWLQGVQFPLSSLLLSVPQVNWIISCQGSVRQGTMKSGYDMFSSEL